jgi:dolichol-phosphate mannosyltransferase
VDVRALVWVVVPTYNEAHNVEQLLAGVRSVLADAAPEGFRILVVDDGSPDGTAAIVRRVAAAHPEVELLERTRKDGLGAAYTAGFTRALLGGAQLVVQMDAGLSHDPAHLPSLLAAARDGGDVVLGSRYVAGGAVEDWSPWRKLVSRGGCWYARTILGVPVRDVTAGYKCFRAGALRAIDYRSIRSQGYVFNVELTYRSLTTGLHVVELPIVFRDRGAGSSKMSGRIAAEAAWLVPALRWTRGRARRLLSGRDTPAGGSR